ncbi:Sugar or nucleoside kinase, ribokinase family [Catalinimonas alkaloidigena]|uniref:Sugar or nucleoside kinase, ribokinase family n=1 Tax=Catalinimonas alkaloidigena TaxID=1075417 RepID=A0A1G8ZV50_9BACT|nr:carbohydrate kinase family protein [Catalinimonas alkaloidigena]SDK18245.1 Sugar or nucleoside kinase, ribokinase family [Catalinimonas alkaloidigena]
MEQQTYDVAVVADLCLDLLMTGNVAPIYGQVEQFVDDYAVELGGSAAIFASQFAKLGGTVGLLAAVGRDPFGDWLHHRLEALSLSTEYVFRTKLKTSVGLGLANGNDRAMLTYAGSMQALTPAVVTGSALLSHTRHVHIASYFLLTALQPYWHEVLPTLRPQGISVSLDTNWAPDEDWSSVVPLLPYVDLFMPNEAEALCISGQANVEDAARWLAQFGGLVVIKRGADGALICQHDALRHFAVPRDLREAMRLVDTTGAGDNFDAGMLFGWLRSEPLDACVALAMRCGTTSLSALGGIAGQVNLREKRLREARMK